jgi:2'-deoxynucleoside 5'-phosphate N-hydrolase
MNIYFGGAIRGGPSDWHTYGQLIAHLKQYGNVLTEHLRSGAMVSLEDRSKNDSEIYTRDKAWMDDADVFVHEVSTPSLGVGYEIANAVQKKKPSLVLYKEGSERQLSGLIGGNPHITIVYYSTLDQAFAAVDEFFKKRK